jgi:hypothetical protein
LVELNEPTKAGKRVALKQAEIVGTCSRSPMDVQNSGGVDWPRRIDIKLFITDLDSVPRMTLSRVVFSILGNGSTTHEKGGDPPCSTSLNKIAA